MPLFAASTPGIWIDRFMVIALTLIPLWVVLWGLRRSRWVAGRTGVGPQRAPGIRHRCRRRASIPQAARPSAGLGAKARLAVCAAGGLGLVAWLLFGGADSRVPALEPTRTEALAAAREAIADSGIEIPEGWRELSAIRGEPGLDDRFVWQEGGPQAYDTLIGSFLAPPRWMVRVVTFEGDVVERAEEVGVSVGGDGEVLRLSHRLPESRAGASLDEETARALARQALRDRFGVDPETLGEISAEPEQQPERVDWKFVFKDGTTFPMDQGEARIAVHLAGDEVVDGYRFVHVPEEWERAERNRRSSAQLVRIVCVVTLILIFVAGAVVAVVRWSRGHFAVQTFAIAFGLLAGTGGLGLYNGWLSITAQFSTAQPYALQSAMVVAGGLLVLLGSAVGVALTVGMVHRWLPEQPTSAGVAGLFPGAALGVALAGLSALATRAFPRLDAAWPSFEAAGARWPFLAAVIDPIGGWIAGAAVFLLIFAAVDALSRRWSRGRVPLSLALVALGFAIAGADGVPTVGRWLAAGLVTGLVLLGSYLVVRHHLALVPVAAAVLTALTLLREGLLGAYPGALAGSIAAVVIIVALGILWARRMMADSVNIAG